MTVDGYTGVDNLEVMLEARNYNAYLVDQVLANARGVDVAVDFGAGIGTFDRALRERGMQVVCIEPEAILQARLRKEGFTVFGMLDELGAAEAEYIFSLNVLEHIEDDVGALREIYRSLVPGGRLYLFVPAFELLYSSMDRKVGHHRRYRKRSLIGKLHGVGFRVESARYADSLGFLASLLYQWFGNKNGDLNPSAIRIYDRLVFPISRGCDVLLSSILGKNLAITAVRPTA